MLGGRPRTGKLFARIFCQHAWAVVRARYPTRTCEGPMTDKIPVPTPGKRLRQAWAAGPVAVPGAFNALTARIIERLGFRAVYLSGGALSAGAGVPDVGLLTLTEFADEARR